MNPVFYDVLIVLIILISALWGRQRGFVLTLCGFLSLFVSLIGAAVLTGLLAPPLSALAVPFVESRLTDLLQASVDTLYADAGGVIHATLDQLLALMDTSELLRGLKGAVSSAVERGALDISGDAVRSVAVYVAEQITRLILFPLFFILLSLIWTALSHVLDLAFHLPGLNFLNRTAGLLLGIARGVLLVIALCWLLKDNYLSRDIVDNSLFLPLIFDRNPLFELPILNL